MKSYLKYTLLLIVATLTNKSELEKSELRVAKSLSVFKEAKESLITAGRDVKNAVRSRTEQIKSLEADRERLLNRKKEISEQISKVSKVV